MISKPNATREFPMKSLVSVSVQRKNLVRGCIKLLKQNSRRSYTEVEIQKELLLLELLLYTMLDAGAHFIFDDTKTTNFDDLRKVS